MDRIYSQNININKGTIDKFIHVLTADSDAFIRAVMMFIAFFTVHYLGIEAVGGAPLVFFILGGSGSTPFMSTWNGKKFELENDFLFGQPKSFFKNLSEGISLYENGDITPDLYRIQNSIRLKDGDFVIQIKEIEPEESYIDYLSLLRVIYPKNTELIVDSKFKKFHVFKNEDIKKLKGVINQKISFNNTDVSVTAGNTDNVWSRVSDSDGYMLDPGVDVIEVSGFVKDTKEDTYLLLRAHIRDWTAGDIFNDFDNNEAILHPLNRKLLKMPILLPSPLSVAIDNIVKFVRLSMRLMGIVKIS